MEQVSLNQLLEAEVYQADGVLAGILEDLLIDPYAGMVRFARIRTTTDEYLLMPWAAMTYAKSGAGFTLTHLGQELLRERLAQANKS